MGADVLDSWRRKEPGHQQPLCLLCWTGLMQFPHVKRKGWNKCSGDISVIRAILERHLLFLWVKVSNTFVLFVLSMEAKVYYPSHASWIMFNWRRPVLTSLHKCIENTLLCKEAVMNFWTHCSGYHFGDKYFFKPSTGKGKWNQYCIRSLKYMSEFFMRSYSFWTEGHYWFLGSCAG